MPSTVPFEELALLTAGALAEQLAATQVRVGLSGKQRLLQVDTSKV